MPIGVSLTFFGLSLMKAKRLAWKQNRNSSHRNVGYGLLTPEWMAAPDRGRERVASFVFIRGMVFYQHLRALG
jgi:hypothetical protein